MLPIKRAHAIRIHGLYLNTPRKPQLWPDKVYNPEIGFALLRMLEGDWTQIPLRPVLRCNSVPVSPFA